MVIYILEKHHHSVLQVPKHYCEDHQNIKAFVLGCDPTAKDKEKNNRTFENVFDIEGGDKRYFSSILQNLNTLGLSLDRIYVQNLVTAYQDKETAKNKKWVKAAKENITLRKQEFDRIDPTGLIPVMLTSYHLYLVLLNQDQDIYSARELYENVSLIPIKAENNQLKRLLISLFRHQASYLKYRLGYQERMKEYIPGNRP